MAPKPERKEEQAESHDKKPAYMKHSIGQPYKLAKKALAGKPLKAAIPCYHCVLNKYECLQSGPAAERCIHCLAMMRKVVDCKPFPAGVKFAWSEGEEEA